MLPKIKLSQEKKEFPNNSTTRTPCMYTPSGRDLPAGTQVIATK